MYKKTIKYTDFNGQERVEDFYFHLSKAEAIKLEMSVNGGLSERMKKLVAKQDGKEIIQIIESLVLTAYGEKSEDGRRFIKSPELTKEFTETEAYSQLFMDFVTNPTSAAEFLAGIMPNDMTEDAKKQLMEEAKKNANVGALLSNIDSSTSTK